MEARRERAENRRSERERRTEDLREMKHRTGGQIDSGELKSLIEEQKCSTVVQGRRVIRY